MAKYARSPFTILIDTREVHPWLFKDIPSSRGQGNILVPCKWCSLGHHSGDYTIEGMECPETRWRLSIERKALDDLFSTILSRRDNFIKELENLNKMEYAAIVVEAPLEQIITYHPQYWEDKKFSPDSQLGKQRQVIGSIQAWQLRYPGIRWWFLSRGYCEIWAYRLFNRFWEDRIKGK